MPWWPLSFFVFGTEFNAKHFTLNLRIALTVISAILGKGVCLISLCVLASEIDVRFWMTSGVTADVVHKFDLLQSPIESKQESFNSLVKNEKVEEQDDFTTRL